MRAALTPNLHYIKPNQANFGIYAQHMVSDHRSKTLRRRLTSLLHPVFRRAPVEGTAGLRNPASCDPVWERGDQVFGERTRVTTGIEFFPNDDFFPDIGSLFIDDMGDNVNANATASASAAATLYDLLIFLFELLLQFLLVVYVVDLFCLSMVLVDRICLSVVLVDRMISLILIILVMFCLLFSRIKSYAKLLIYSTFPSAHGPRIKPPEPMSISSRAL